MPEPEFKKEDFEKITEILNKHREDRSSLVAILQDVNEEFRYLPEDILKFISIKFGIPLSEIYNMATFYKAFSLKPRGKHVISVCLGTACHVRGAPRILEEIKRILNIKEGETTEDRLFTLETVNCLGACALGPIVVVDNKYHGQMTIRKTSKLIERIKETEK
ncbi:NAD(P)H-dependent oxidoreductase subunit E [SCandidatus Aminicenantes bacterium Aminicenantia_JdfR_composite]|nr:NAD(P)H-dependent oxidoreductase subunit E [SCandidatus Aminicenantes bacterium Aminicenantia_JdfR_composite]MCP2596925.1 NAD(P)H-dependent oxidoreductase subunit E [Candidatus Aminicenantes bacterium AC-335-G13]